MNDSKKGWLKRFFNHPFFHKYVRFRSSIYVRVVYIITIISLILFVSIGLIFRSVYEDYMKTVIVQNGNNVDSMVQGSLYHSMLNNDKTELQNTLDVINTMSGIDEVSMYNQKDSLVYSSVPINEKTHTDLNCVKCHNQEGGIFPKKEKAYRIIGPNDECIKNFQDSTHRHLLIRSPILNERSCYTAGCHYHSKDEEVLGSLMIKIPLRNLDEAVQESSTKFYVLATISTILLIVVFIIFTHRKIQRPLNKILIASEKVAGGNRDTRLSVNANELEDIRTVSMAFNKMLDNLQSATRELENWSNQLEYKVQKKTEELGAAQNELIHVERIASLGKLSSSVAHEINNPLSGVLTYTKLVNKQLRNQHMDERAQQNMLKYLTIIEKETKRCGDIVKGLLDFSRSEQQNFRICHTHSILKETYDLMAHQMEMSNIVFNTQYNASKDSVKCSPNQIKQACVAILQNASEAVGDDGVITMKTVNPDNEHIRIDIEDNGTGIAEEDIPHLFEPFFSAKQKTSGIGLGLSIVHGIVQSHQGQIKVDSELGKGTTLSIILPLTYQND